MFVEVNATRPPEHIESAGSELPYGHPSHPEVRIQLTARGVLMMERMPYRLVCNDWGINPFGRYARKCGKKVAFLANLRYTCYRSGKERLIVAKLRDDDHEDDVREEENRQAHT